MKITEKQKLIIAIIMFGLSAFVIYRTFFSTPEAITVATDTSDPNVVLIEEGQDILDLADKLSAMSIDSKIFDSVVFTSLVDFKVPLIPEPKGRPNPFAPIGNDSGYALSSSSISDLIKPKIVPTISTSEI